MPYLGNDPGAITDAFTDTFTGDASETNFTLTRASTTNSVFVRIHGVMQRNGTDFTVDGTTLTFTTAPPNASNNIVVQFFTVGSVQTVADNAVTLAKLAGGTDGNLITFDASGDPAFVATGNDGQVLTSAGAGAAPAFEAIPAVTVDLVLLSTQTASNAASIDFTSSHFDNSTYTSYVFKAFSISPATDAAFFMCRTSSDGGSSYDSGASDYDWCVFHIDTNGAANDIDLADDGIDMYRAAGDRGMSNVAAESGSGTIHVDGAGVADYTKVYGEVLAYDSASTASNCKATFGGHRNSAADVDGIQFLMSSGNLDGTIKMYGMK
jgi:hypothetical protein